MAETPLLPLLQDFIRKHGAITVGQYMALCLGHPQHGYYMAQEPFGENGDFTTAPEISQLFGEMVALWVMTTWQHLGKPDTIQLVELGAGRGTWMKDIHRALAVLPELRDVLSIHIVEFGARLQDVQRGTLHGLQAIWHESFDTVPQRTSLIIANEFFDALPINQAVYHNGEWHERVIISDEEDLLFGIGARLKGIFVSNPDDGVIFEYAPLMADIMIKLCAFMKNNGGALLAIDYGDDIDVGARLGETLQALHQKKPDHVLAHPGQADLTAHVAFAALKQIANDMKLVASLQTQREFLTQYGIRMRAETLLAAATPEQAKGIHAAVHRLVDPAAMGDLFKVLQVIAS